jgi:hypothetical protein
LSISRPRLALLLSVLACGLLAACGSSDSGEQASSATDVNQLLRDTFAGDKAITSGKLAVAMRLDATGGNAQGGPVSIRLSGPFQTQGAKKLPKFQLQLAVDGAGQNITAGATSTGDKAFVAFQGRQYAVSDQVFRQFRAGYEQAAAQGDQGAKGQSFASLGMDPRRWLTAPRNAGEAKVGDDDTIKITGGVDVSALLDDVNVALGKAASLGLQGTGQVPDKITAAQKREAVAAIKDPRVEIYTGKDDRILRRMVVNLGVDDSSSSTKAKLGLDIAVADVNQDQDINEPSGAKPFDQLLSQLGGLGVGLGGAAKSGGSSSSSGNGNLEQYSTCVNKAGDDVAKARKCADLLTD